MVWCQTVTSLSSVQMIIRVPCLEFGALLSHTHTHTVHTCTHRVYCNFRFYSYSIMHAWTREETMTVSSHNHSTLLNYNSILNLQTFPSNTLTPRLRSSKCWWIKKEGSVERAMQIFYRQHMSMDAHICASVVVWSGTAILTVSPLRSDSMASSWKIPLDSASLTSSICPIHFPQSARPLWQQINSCEDSSVCPLAHAEWHRDIQGWLSAAFT